MKSVLAPMAMLMLIAACAAADKPATQWPVDAPVATVSWALTSIDYANTGDCDAACGNYFQGEITTPMLGTVSGRPLCRFTVSSSQATAGTPAGTVITGTEYTDSVLPAECRAATLEGNTIVAVRGEQTYGCGCCGTINRKGRYSNGCHLAYELAPVGAACTSGNIAGQNWTTSASSRICAFEAELGATDVWGYVYITPGGEFCAAVNGNGNAVQVPMTDARRMCYIQRAYTPPTPRDRKADRG